MVADARTRVTALSCWSGPVDAHPVAGGITNANFRVDDHGEAFFVRIGTDIPEHGILRFHERMASRAAHACGLSPEVVHEENGALVLRFIDGRTLQPEDIRHQSTLEKILPLLVRCHRELPQHLRGATLAFWVFHVLRDYGHRLHGSQSSWANELPRLSAAAEKLEHAIGPTPLVFGHNDLLAGNFMDDGTRIWLIDWDYAGWGNPLFDLGGLASNNGLSEAQELWLLESYFARPVDEELRRSYAAMKCASLLREALWSMVSELHSELEFDYAAYTGDYLARFDRAYAEFPR
jgi:thiamine kinase-like enzyme